MKEQTMQKENYAIPIAIIIAGALIGTGLYFTQKNTAQQAVNAPSQQQEAKDTTNKVRTVDASDHFKGNPNATVTIVEYSDFECPFCKRAHETLTKVIADNKDIKWVFRQFPLDSLHPRNARKAAEASECVSKLGGNDAFWKFTDAYFASTLTNDRWNIADELDRLVKIAGVDKTAFDTCYNAEEFKDKVQKDEENAIATGGRGTPWSVVIMKSGKTIPLNGAQPEEAIKQMIEFAKKN